MANLWPVQLIVTGVVHIFTIAFVLGTVVVLVRKRKIRLEDGLVGISWVFAITQWSLLLVSFYASSLDYTRSRHTLFASVLFYSPAITLVKISAVRMLLRVQNINTSYRTFLYITILLQALPSAMSLIFQITRCRPLSYNWNPIYYPDATCVNEKGTLAVLYTEACTGITASLALIVFASAASKGIWSKDFLEKMGLTLMMTLGLFSIAANVARTTLLHSSLFFPLATSNTTSNNNNNNNPHSPLEIPQWALLEEQAIILFLLLPSLKPLFQPNLHRFSIHSYTDRETQTSRFNRLSNDPHPLPPLHRSHSLKKQHHHHHRHPHTHTHTHKHPPRALTPTLPFIPTPALKTTIANITRERTTPSPHALPAAAPSSAETIWPAPTTLDHLLPAQDAAMRSVESLERREEDELLREGGILLTTEFSMRSEVVSRMPSRDDVFGEGRMVV